MPQKITDDELLTRVEQELRATQDYMGGKLSAQRRRALAYYMGLAEGELAPPEIDGRSSFVSTNVRDTIEWMLPSLLRIFTGSDRVVSLTPRKPSWPPNRVTRRHSRPPRSCSSRSTAFRPGRR